MNLHWLLRLRRWAQNPPSPRMVAFVLGILLLCLALVAVEYWLGWPEWLTPAGGGGRGGMPRF